MLKAIVIYESVFGNTKRATEAIIEGMKGATFRRRAPQG